MVVLSLRISEEAEQVSQETSAASGSYRLRLDVQPHVRLAAILAGPYITATRTRNRGKTHAYLRHAIAH
jgi:hypothetical protein